MATVLRGEILAYAVHIANRLYPDFSYEYLKYIGREYSILRARNVVWAVMYGTGMWSFAQIGRMTNGQSAASVLNSIRSISKLHGADLLKIYSEELDAYVRARANEPVVKQGVRRDTPQDGAGSRPGD